MIIDRFNDCVRIRKLRGQVTACDLIQLHDGCCSLCSLFCRYEITINLSLRF